MVKQGMLCLRALNNKTGGYLVSTKGKISNCNKCKQKRGIKKWRLNYSKNNLLLLYQERL